MKAGFLRRAATSAWLALVVATVIVAFQITAKPPRPIYADELEYLSVSRNIVVHGVFSDAKPSSAPVQPNAFFTPVAPYLYALLMKADPVLRESIDCQMQHPAEPLRYCRVDYGRLMPVVMTILAAIGLWGGWLLARSLGFGYTAAWVVLAVIAVSGVHGHFARHFLTEAPLLAAFPFFLVLLGRATDPDDRMPGLMLLLCGIAMGLLALIRPSYVYQAYIMLLLLPMLRHFRGARPIGAWGLGASLWAGAGYLLAVLPWMIRNAVDVGSFVLTNGYDTSILAQRMMYNQMSWAEWGMAWIYWLPDFGDTLGIALFGEEAVRKLSLLDPSGYHGGGNPPVTDFLRTKLGGAAPTLGNLLPHLLMEMPKHVMVTLVMAWQGFWAGKYITLIALLLAPFALPAMAATGRLRAFLVIALPVLLMVGFNAFVSVSIPRYNLPLLWLSALIAAALVEAGLRHFNQSRSQPAAKG